MHRQEEDKQLNIYKYYNFIGLLFNVKLVYYLKERNRNIHYSFFSSTTKYNI